MRLLIHDTPADVARWTARYIAAKINLHDKVQDGHFVLGLPTGSSPLATYKELIALHKAGEVSFANVVTFNMDEYVGLTEDHPQSYHRFMWDNFFSHIDIPRENVNILNGMAKDLALECSDYEERIAEQGGIDLFLGGIGSDGHLAFNEPFSSLGSFTRIKSLTEDTVIANSRFFDNDVNKVPRQSLTVGVATVMAAREVIVLATGHAKARALRHVVEEGVSHMWTASALQTHRHALILCDEQAVGELRVSTYRYFKQLEEQSPKKVTNR
ncbi:MAG: glucosamine-6-phosphate deaminase [Rikenellaceae bacterium]|jgi:glucosamine-6-phosphate deaminase|nr:glucosamine-6-phosphate deaminase [Rikenellaceae bacterium]